MQVFDSPATMRAYSTAQRVAGRRIGLVPTMGALHPGHLALVAAARRTADVIVVSIFVNPMQFNRRDDFDTYPRPIDDDLALCRSHGVDAVYAPTAAAMYPAGFETSVEPGSLATPLEGAARPGHFRGVTTVVTKLFNAVRPDVAVFGRKDFQQLAIIRRMTIDLDMGITIVGLDTIREPDGVAMSSRNRRLSVQDRAAAMCIPRALSAAADLLAGGERRVSALLAAARVVLDREPRARVEYLDCIDPETLQPVAVLSGDVLSGQVLSGEVLSGEVLSGEVLSGEAGVIVAAVWFGDVRLIDNRLLRSVEQRPSVENA